MEQVLRYGIPVLHPVVVHFPIGFGILSAVAVAAWLLRNRTVWLASALFIQALSFLGALVAFLSGEKMHEQSEGVPIVEELVHIHEDAALVATWIFGITLAAMVGAYFFARQETKTPGTPLWIRVALFLLSLAGAAAIGWTAHVGGIMVWGTLS